MKHYLDDHYRKYNPLWDSEIETYERNDCCMKFGFWLFMAIVATAFILGNFIKI